MDITEGESVKVKVEEDDMFHESINSGIKTEIVKEEPREDTDTSKEDAKPKVANTGSSSSWKEGDSIMKLIHSEVTVKEEEYLDSPEYMSTDTGFECEIGQVKIENDNNILCETIEIESVKEELTDNEDSFSADMLTQDSSEDLQPGSSTESQKAKTNAKSEKCCLVPGCISSTTLTSNKLFVPLPRSKNERQSWQLAMRRTDFVSQHSTHYVCEDHFKLEDEAENYMQFSMMGNVKLKLKPGVMPSLFACQRRSGPPREYSAKRRLPDVVQEACVGAKKSKKSQAKEVRHQGTQTEYHLYMRDVGIQVNLLDDKEPKQTQTKTRKSTKKRTKKIK